MKLQFIVASILCSLLFSQGAGAEPARKATKINSKKMGLSIRVDGGGWGNACTQDIETVLYSVADELLARVPAKLNTPIVVTHSHGNPIALYDKGANGEYRVQLHARDQRWSQLAYEFAHELCHIMSNYEENVGADTVKHNQWFEETLCEAASLYTLRSMAATWESPGDDARWAHLAPNLRKFADQLVAEGHRRLPDGTPLATWLRDNEQRLRNDPYLRDKNEAIANLLLPLFEENPDSWDALHYLNLDPGDARNDFGQYLRNWYANAAPGHRAFVASVLNLFGIDDAAPSGVAQAVSATAIAASGAASFGGQAGPVSR
jgi:hypothetical protein